MLGDKKINLHQMELFIKYGRSLRLKEQAELALCVCLHVIVDITVPTNKLVTLASEVRCFHLSQAQVSPLWPSKLEEASSLATAMPQA